LDLLNFGYSPLRVEASGELDQTLWSGGSYQIVAIDSEGGVDKQDSLEAAPRWAAHEPEEIPMGLLILLVGRREHCDPRSIVRTIWGEAIHIDVDASLGGVLAGWALRLCGIWPGRSMIGFS
jgi:hypothetical protein